MRGAKNKLSEVKNLIHFLQSEKFLTYFWENRTESPKHKVFLNFSGTALELFSEKSANPAILGNITRAQDPKRA